MQVGEGGGKLNHRALHRLFEADAVFTCDNFEVCIFAEMFTHNYLAYSEEVGLQLQLLVQVYNTVYPWD